MKNQDPPQDFVPYHTLPLSEAQVRWHGAHFEDGRTVEIGQSPEVPGGVFFRFRNPLEDGKVSELHFTLSEEAAITLWLLIKEEFSAKPPVAIPTPTPSPDRWLIWSNEHRAWWRTAWAGYTVSPDAAGRYTQAEAEEICRQAAANNCQTDPPPEVMLPESCLPVRKPTQAP